MTHENVDLNRNFLDFSKPRPVNEGYGELHSLLLPETWPPAPEVQQQVQHYIATRGMKALQAAVSARQYDFPEGLFFGGHAPTWSNTALRQVLRDFCGQASHVAWVDLHTGLGPPGLGERIYSGQGLQAMRAEQWLQLHPEAPAPKAAAIKQALRDYFFVDTDEWKTQVLRQGLDALAQMVGVFPSRLSRPECQTP